MKYIEKFIISDNLSIIINHDESHEEKTVLVEKKVNGQIRVPYQGRFDNKTRKLKFNTEYLVLCNRGFSLQDANLTIISLNTGKEVKENKAKIYKEVNKVNKYGSFEVKSFPKR